MSVRRRLVEELARCMRHAGSAALAMLAFVAACDPALPAVTFVIDPTIDVPVGELPGFEDGAPRPIAVVTGDDGAAAMFVEDEVWLQTDDKSELDAFLGRWRGTVLSTFDPAEAGLAGLPKHYLIRIDASAADTKKLPDSLRELDRHATGDHAVSSEAGLSLLAASSEEAAAGVALGVNWVGEGDQFIDRTTIEAVNGEAMSGVPYVSDAFSWPSHTTYGVQDIGVAEAWRALEMAGKLDNHVRLAVLDMGFEPDYDTPQRWVAISNVPFRDATGSENLLFCGDNDCPWHGQNVLSAAMALADNGYGAAGSAGPVADPILVYTLYDFFTSIQALYLAKLAGAKIANMSYSAPVPYSLGWSVLPFEAATAAFRLSGMLIFAAAGNEGKNVDSEECTWGICWERTWYTPCENSGVICVGGLAANSRYRAGDSNFGVEQVPIFAPFTLWLGPDPSAPANAARVKSGTSFSSPFTAGIAALIWAADPSLSAGDVEDILISTAHPNPDGSVVRHVNALGAVLAALGNVPPAIDLPSYSGETQLNDTSSFSATVTDIEDAFPCCTVSWESDVDGPLGTGSQVEHTFTTLGARTITVSATDSDDATAVESFVLTVVNAAPVADITTVPSVGGVFRTATTIFRGEASDLNETDDELPCSGLVWTSSEVSDPFPQTGCEIEAVFATNGPRTLTLTATDAQNASDTDSIAIMVVDPPLNLPPVVQITSPTHHQAHLLNLPMSLTGIAADPEGQTALTYRWTVERFNEGQIELGTAPSITWTPTDNYTFNVEGIYTFQVRLFVTDPGGSEGVDTVELEWILIF